MKPPEKMDRRELVEYVGIQERIINSLVQELKQQFNKSSMSCACHTPRQRKKRAPRRPESG